MSIDIINPSTGKIVRSFSEMSQNEVFEIIEKSHAYWQEWKSTKYEARSTLLRTIAKLLRDSADQLANLMAEEMGKPLQEGLSEVEKCAWVCEYYAEHGPEMLKREYIATEASESFVSYQPIGTVLAIMPWNFPLWQVFRFIAPAMMAGNVGILKHAPNVTGCAMQIEDIFRSAGASEFLFKVIITDISLTTKVIEHPKIAAITLTGSTKAGKAVASKAAENLKKTVLELGGSDPYIIMDDADIKQAAKLCVTSRLLNSGQSCIAAKRFIVTSKNKTAFTNAVVDLMKEKKMGDPFDEHTDIGPIARKDLRDQLNQQVSDSLAKGAHALLGGEVPDRDGFFYPPTLLTDVKPGMPAYGEELFGPVATIITVENELEALKVANDTPFGLGAAIFSRNEKKALTLAEHHIHAGAVFINDFVKSDPRLPFGGIKQSGYGRELSHFGIREFTNIKTISVA